MLKLRRLVAPRKEAHPLEVRLQFRHLHRRECRVYDCPSPCAHRGTIRTCSFESETSGMRQGPHGTPLSSTMARQTGSPAQRPHFGRYINSSTGGRAGDDLLAPASLPPVLSSHSLSHARPCSIRALTKSARSNAAMSLRRMRRRQTQN